MKVTGVKVATSRFAYHGRHFSSENSIEHVSYLRLVQWVEADQRADDVEVSSRMSARRG